MKKVLPLAVMAALAGVNSAQADVHVNPDGLGQVLLYPFYTTQGDQDTLIALANTTAEYKAVKVRILEALNSQEVLDFNLYLSPYDHWSAVITRDPAGDGALIATGDRTCTVPNSLGQGVAQPFRNLEFSTDLNGNGLDRTKEGYVEIIEMGVINTADSTVVGSTTLGAILGAAIKHVNGEPGSCATLQQLWSAGGLWNSTNGAAGVIDPTGGLYGYGSIINAVDGTNAAYDATAIADFFDPFAGSSLHTAPGSLLPGLAQSNPAFAIFDDAAVVTDVAALGLDAVSAIMMQNVIANDYVLEPSIVAGTDWVVTFPTKRNYVNGQPAAAPGTGAAAPFSAAYRAAPISTSLLNTKSCEPIEIVYFDREERGQSPDELDFSPTPDQQAITLCAEANILTFNNANVLEASAFTFHNLDVLYDNGWLSMGFGPGAFLGTPPAVVNLDQSAGNVRQLVAGGTTLTGLPVIGFAVQKYLNTNGGGAGVQANYAGAIAHKGDRLISSGGTTP